MHREGAQKPAFVTEVPSSARTRTARRAGRTGAGETTRGFPDTRMFMACEATASTYQFLALKPAMSVSFPRLLPKQRTCSWAAPFIIMVEDAMATQTVAVDGSDLKRCPSPLPNWMRFGSRQYKKQRQMYPVPKLAGLKRSPFRDSCRQFFVPWLPQQSLFLETAPLHLLQLLPMLQGVPIVEVDMMSAS